MARENCGVALGEHVLLNPIRSTVQEPTKVVVKAVSSIDPTESEFVLKTLLAEQLGIQKALIHVPMERLITYTISWSIHDQGELFQHFFVRRSEALYCRVLRARLFNAL